jgi:hypothetical protein
MPRHFLPRCLSRSSRPDGHAQGRRIFRTLWRIALAALLLALCFWCRQSIADTSTPPVASRTLAPQTSTQSTPTGEAPICQSAPLWRDIPGPRGVVTIGSRTLHIPVAMPFARFDANMVGGDAHFSFHVDPDGRFSFGGIDATKQLIWTYLVTVDVTNAPGQMDNTAFLHFLMQGRTFDQLLSKQNRIYDVYTWGVDTLYVERRHPTLGAYDCLNKFPGFPGPQAPSCSGYQRPWAGAGLKYVFGASFLPIAPLIRNCIEMMLQDFSK